MNYSLRGSSLIAALSMVAILLGAMPSTLIAAKPGVVNCITTPCPGDDGEQNSFRVTAPAGGAVYTLGQTMKISWEVPSNSFAAEFVRLSAVVSPSCLDETPACAIRTVGPIVIAESTDHDGQYDWTIPTNLAATYRGEFKILIEVLNRDEFAYSDRFILGDANTAKLTVNTATLPNGSNGVMYSYPLTAFGGIAPYTWTGTTGNSGLTLSKDGMLSGTPRLGVHRITANVTDASGATASVQLQLNVTSQQVDQPHPAGSLVLGFSSVYPSGVALVQNDNGMLKLRTFGSAEVFLSHGYKWSNIVIANSGDKALFFGEPMGLASGTLVRDRSNLRSFYVVYPNNVLRPFSSFEVFNSLGYRASNAYTTSLAGYTMGSVMTIFDSHAPGTDIIDNGTVYWISENNTRHPYPSVDVYNTWHTNNNDFSRVYQANSFDRLIPIGSPIQPR